VGQRVSLGEIEHVAEQGVAGRAAAGGGQAATAGEAHDVPDDQEVVAEALGFDDGQLVLQPLPHLGGNVAIAPLGADIAQAAQIAAGILTGGGRREQAGAFGGDGLQVERWKVEAVQVRLPVAALGDRRRLPQGLGQVGEQLPHLRR
jgi:hypothetical protein